VSFIDEWVTPNGVTTIFRMENKEAGTIDFCVLINQIGYIELHCLRITYT